MKNVFVNAVAVKSGGMLTIFNQFLDSCRDDVQYYIFTSSKLFESDENKRNIVVSNKGWASRILWDGFGFWWWSVKRSYSVDVVVSLQNTGVFFPKVLKFVYLQQALPFAPFSWSFFKPAERKMWFYKYVYKYIMKFSFSSDTTLIVQTKSMDDLVSTGGGVKNEKVIVRPELTIEEGSVADVVLDDDFIHFFYPASMFKYKNHDILVDSLVKLKYSDPNILRRLKIIFTVEESENLGLLKEIEGNGLSENFIFTGEVSIDKVYSYYKRSDFLLYPSYVESFGLPLLEAKQFDLAIIASDLPYVLDAVENYKKLKRVTYNSIDSWSLAIKQATIGDLKFDDRQGFISDGLSWEGFHELLYLGDN